MYTDQLIQDLIVCPKTIIEAPKVHTVKAEDINNGNKVEKHIQKTEEYLTLEDAIQFYIKYINILPADRKKYFPTPSGQIELDF